MERLKILFTISLLLILSACGGSDSETPPPITEPNNVQTVMAGNQTVEILLSDGDAQLAGTTEGLYWRADADSEWQLRSPTNTGVAALTVLGSGHYLIAVKREDMGDFSQPYPLYESQDHGETWVAVNHDFGRDSHSVIYALIYDSSQDRIYASSATALAVANLDASQWTLLDGQWDGAATGLEFILADSIHESVWYGGQGAIENGYFKRLDLASGTITEWHGLLPDPSVYKAALIHPVDTSTILIGSEGGMVRSTDYGENWNVSISGDPDINPFYLDIVIDSDLKIYTAQWLKSGPVQPLILSCSPDSGASWRTNDYASELTHGGVKSLMLVEHNNQTWLYLGMQSNGIKTLNLTNIQC